MKLKELLDQIYPVQIPRRFQEIDVKEMSCDSRTLGPQSLFVAVQGVKGNGEEFIPQAIEKGAVVVVQNGPSNRIFPQDDVCVLTVPDTKKFIIDLAQKFFNYPASRIKTIGITGTNGKTTTAYLIESIFKACQKSCAVIGTVNYRIGDRIMPSKNTTPGLIEMQQYLAEMNKEKIEYCVMEVSSHALHQGRVEAIDFSTAVFTNLTQDHLDYHQDMESYFLAKSKLFVDLPRQSHAVINIDDIYAQRLITLCDAEVSTYGINLPADFQAEHIQLTLDDSRFEIRYPRGHISIRTQQLGMHNVYNILAAFAVGFSQGIDPVDIKKAVEEFWAVPGRLERVNAGQNFHVFVDYAHTDDALQNVLTSFRKVSKARMILVFGCGGNRDKLKRPKMGRVASQYADHVIVTSDNPRDEDPQMISREILAGFSGNHFETILDRQEAIHKALSMAQKGEIVLIAGKGHEDYQIIKDKTIHFDDREVAREYLRCLV